MGPSAVGVVGEVDRTRPSFLFGYRVLDFDYVRGSGSDRFEYDMTLHGPFVAFQFKF